MLVVAESQKILSVLATRRIDVNVICKKLHIDESEFIHLMRGGKVPLSMVGAIAKFLNFPAVEFLKERKIKNYYAENILKEEHIFNDFGNREL